MKSLAELDKIRKETLEQINLRTDNYEMKIVVGMAISVCCWCKTRNERIY